MSEKALEGLKKAQAKMLDAFCNEEVQISFTNGELIAIKMMARDWVEAALDVKDAVERKTLLETGGSIIQKISNHYK